MNKTTLKWLLRLTLGVGIVVLLLARTDTSAFLKAMRGVPLFVPPLAVLFYWLTQCLSAAKWQLLLRARGAEIFFVECARLYLLGMFCNLFLPTAIGGDGVRALAVAPRVDGLPTALSSILIERLTGLAALLTMGALGLALYGSGNAMGAQVLPRAVAVLLGLALAFFAVRALVYRLETTASGRAGKVAAKLGELHRALDFYALPQHRKTLAAAFALSLIFHAMHIAANIFLARAVGLDAPATDFLWLVPMLSLASMIPLGIGGLGVREAAAVAVLGPQALAWSLLWQATVWLASLPGGFFMAGRKVKGEVEGA